MVFLGGRLLSERLSVGVMPLPSNLKILSAERADARPILELQREAYRSEAILYEDWNIPPLIQTLPELEKEFEESVLLKAVLGDDIVGSVRARAMDGIVHIGRLIVAPTVQRRGIGGALLQAIESVFPAAHGFDLFTGSRSEGNIRLYQRHGYAVTHEKVLSPKVTLVFMRKSKAPEA